MFFKCSERQNNLWVTRAEKWLEISHLQRNPTDVIDGQYPSQNHWVGRAPTTQQGALTLIGNYLPFVMNEKEH